MSRSLTLGFAAVFTIVVAIGYIPAFITTDGSERLMFGLFELSLIDDITHGVTALAALAAAAVGRRACMLFLTAFGFYYGIDAVFYLVYGLFNEQGFIADILLNLPHVGIATIMLGYVYRLAPKLEP